MKEGQLYITVKCALDIKNNSNFIAISHSKIYYGKPILSLSLNFWIKSLDGNLHYYTQFFEDTIDFKTPLSYL